MSEWFKELSMFQKILWYIAVPSTVLCALQIILMMLGIGESEDPDVDVDIDGNDDMFVPMNFKILTIKNIIFFLTIFSWGTLMGIDKELGIPVSLLIGIISGIVVVGGLTAVMNLAKNKLVEDGTMDIKNAVGLIGNVYLKIPKNSEGIGKIQIIVQGSLRELDAITRGDEIVTGEEIIVSDIIDDKVVVEKVNQLKKIQ